MKKSRLLGAVCAISMCILASTTHAAIVTYTFSNSNFSGFYTFDRSEAEIRSNARSYGGKTNVSTNNSIIDYEFTVNLPQFDFARTYTPSNTNTSSLENNLETDDRYMAFRLGEGGEEGKTLLSFSIFTEELAHPYDSGDNPFDLPPAFDYFYSDFDDLGAKQFIVRFLTVDGTGGLKDHLDTLSVTVDASVVPIPAAAWLFGSGLIGLVGMARRKVK